MKGTHRTDEGTDARVSGVRPSHCAVSTRPPHAQPAPAPGSGHSFIPTKAPRKLQEPVCSGPNGSRARLELGLPASRGHAGKPTSLHPRHGRTSLLPEGSSFPTEHRPQLPLLVTAPPAPLHRLPYPLLAVDPADWKGGLFPCKPPTCPVPVGTSPTKSHSCSCRPHRRMGDLLPAWPCPEALSAACRAGTTLAGSWLPRP